MKLGAIVLDSGDPEALAGFYSRLLGWKRERHDFEDEIWYVVKSEHGVGTPLVFQQADGYRRPQWPDEPGAQQQMLHLDFYVTAEKYKGEVEHAVACGATVSTVQLSASWTVLLDPAGHPFCVIPLPME